MRRQHGSVVAYIVIAILIAIAFWQRERITRWVPGMGAKNAAPVLEVTGFDCTPPGPGASVQGTVRNKGTEPLALKAIVTWKISGQRPMLNYPQVSPATLAPGASGRFSVQLTLPPGGGECLLGGFLDAGNTHLYFDSRSPAVRTFQ